MRYTTESPVLRKTGTSYKLARQMGSKYFPTSPLDGTYAIMDMLETATEIQLTTTPLTLDNGL